MTARRFISMAASAFVFVFVSACGTVEPEADEQIVVEAFVVTNSELPMVTLRKTAPLRAGARSDRPEEQAHVLIRLNDEPVPYHHHAAGRYHPAAERDAAAGDDLELIVSREGASLRAKSRLPQPIRIDSVAITPADQPIEAVLIDSLSLEPGSGETGYIYLVDVDVLWAPVQVDDSAHVRLQLRPDSTFGSLVMDLFLRSDEVLFEDAATIASSGHRRWQGVYAVRVDGPDAPFPRHGLRISLLRSGPDYARFALSRDAADRREPVGNIDGGLGIFAAIAIDSLNVLVE